MNWELFRALCFVLIAIAASLFLYGFERGFQ